MGRYKCRYCKDTGLAEDLATGAEATCTCAAGAKVAADKVRRQEPLASFKRIVGLYRTAAGKHFSMGSDDKAAQYRAAALDIERMADVLPKIEPAPDKPQ